MSKWGEKDIKMLKDCSVELFERTGFTAVSDEGKLYRMVSKTETDVKLVHHSGTFRDTKEIKFSELKKWGSTVVGGPKNTEVKGRVDRTDKPPKKETEKTE